MPLYFVPLVLSDGWKAAKYGGYFFMKEIVINSKTQGTQKILVDDLDYDWLNSFNWSIHKIKKRMYACSRMGGGPLKSMHRLIMNPKHSKIYVDHIDGNGLNNQRLNLRLCNQLQNTRNASVRANNKVGFKGVSQNKANNYVAEIWVNYKKHFLGSFKTPIDAAKAYNTAALKYHGEFARLNEIPCVG